MKCTRKKVQNKASLLKIVKDDPWLEPFEAAITGRHNYVNQKIQELTGGKTTLSDFADGHLYFGLHRTASGWVFREWAPNATAIYLIGDFNQWTESEKYRLNPVKGLKHFRI